MTTEQVIKAIEELISRHRGDEYDLMEALDTLAEGWHMRYQELRDEQGDGS